VLFDKITEKQILSIFFAIFMLQWLKMDYYFIRPRIYMRTLDIQAASTKRGGTFPLLGVARQTR